MTARLAASLMAGLLLCACSGDSPDAPPPTPDPDITISFSLVTSKAPVSRATGDYTDGPATASEEYIDVDGGDIRFFLFDNTGKFLQDMTPAVTVTGPVADGTITIYNCIAPIADEYFEEIIKDNSATEADFYILVIANGKSMRLGYPYFERDTRLSSVFSSLVQTAMPSIPDTQQLLDPSKGGQHIPMSGIRYFSVDPARLRASSEEAPADISGSDNPLELLRAMGKIEIIDKIDITGEWNDSYLNNTVKRIQSADFSGIMSAGSPVPTASQWWTYESYRYATAQVNSPTRTSDATYTTQQPVAMLSDAASSKLNHKNFPVYSCYVWEYDNAWRSPTSEAPYMTIRLGDGKNYRLNFRVYNEDGDQDDFNMILRNHVYRFEIVGVGHMEGTLNANWTVCPMTTAEITIPPYN